MTIIESITGKMIVGNNLLRVYSRPVKGDGTRILAVVGTSMDGTEYIFSTPETEEETEMMVAEVAKLLAHKMFITQEEIDIRLREVRACIEERQNM